MVMQDPKFSLNPVMTIGQQLMEAVRLHGASQPRRATSRMAMLEAVQIRDPERVMARLSARTVGRHGPAHHDRHDAGDRAGSC
jgi:ABC-type dipeptide/oligopeptide/nickel transport system ATPase component